MLVRDFMTTKVTSLADTDTLLDASMIFVRSTYRHLPVLRGKQVVGMITEHDIKKFVPSLLKGMNAEDYNQVLETTSVSRAMTHDPVTIGPGQSMYEAATILYNKRVGCLPVVEKGELMGIISTTDMLKLLVRLLTEPDLFPRSLPPERELIHCLLPDIPSDLSRFKGGSKSRNRPPRSHEVVNITSEAGAGSDGQCGRGGGLLFGCFSGVSGFNRQQGG
jgi:acetoin utilization protein AcuB